jgi:DNA repair protein RadA/Sms
MAKAAKKSAYVCRQCGAESRKWFGQCPGCKGWNTLEEVAVAEGSSTKARGRGTSGARPAARAVPIRDINPDEVPRSGTGIGELDRVLGGGLVAGSLVLIGGEPGVGKSTLLLSSAASLARTRRVLYVSAEESLGQSRLRAERLDALADELHLLSETDFGVIQHEVQRLKPDVLVIDSVQTVFVPELDSAPGSVSQVREVCARAMHLAKVGGVSTFLVGHVTKDGNIAGPKMLEHMVDTVLHFEGARTGAYRVLRAHKNRFGSTNEIAVFEMRGDGLEEVPNPSAFFLAERPEDAPGSVVAAAMEGSRPILVEVQGLVVDSPFGNPRRTTVGIDGTRCAILAAVLERRCGLSLAGQDLFVNVAGGVQLSEPAADLPVALAIASSLGNRAVDAGLVCFGEIGLSGEIRGVQRAEARLHEAQKLGFTRALLPANGLDQLDAPEGLALMGVKDLAEAIEVALGDQA